MDKIKWTKDQEKAIKARGSSIIVSAAAGSGKTEILSQRIVEIVENGIFIDKLLVVTFTNAAAEQMRLRISKKLDNLVLKNPKNEHIKKQQSLMLVANIQTVHGFCQNLIRENFAILDICPNFKIANNFESLILSKKAMDLILEDFYKEASEDFIDLANSLSSQKDDSLLVQLIEKLHDFLNSIPFPKEWMDSTLKKLEKNDDIWQKIIIKDSKEKILGFENILKSLIDSVKIKEKMSDIYLKFLTEELQALENLRKSFDKNDFFLCKEVLSSFVFSRLPSSKGSNDEILKEKISFFQKKVKQDFKKFLEAFSYTREEILFLNKKTHNFSKTLFYVFKKFKKKFCELKKEKNILDFSDLEHLAIKLLVDKNKNKTDLAKEMSLNFEEILIDEYQDTNEIQEIIFKAISKNEKNLFMVGDVKQSIYSFRKAKPEIFIKRKERSSFCKNFNINSMSKISLDENFRSDEKILDFVNFLFQNIMTKDSCSVEYKNHEEMKAFNNKSLKEASTDVFILETLDANDKQRAKNEAEFVAKTIKKMVDSSHKIGKKKLEYKDFCVLFRSMNSWAKIFKDTFEEKNIKTFINLRENFFSLKEVSMILCLLEVIDNPSKDLSVVGALMSPLFNFDVNKMSLIRLENKDLNFYSCVKSYAKKDIECERFCKKIDELRFFSKNNCVSFLINKIYVDFDVFSVVGVLKDFENKSANLRKFLHFAKSSNSYTLYDFLNFTEEIKRNEILINPSCDLFLQDNSVKIMSIHGAKGLEFPVVILANCSSSFHKEKEDSLFDEDLGVGVKILDINIMKKYHTIQRDAIYLKQKNALLSEEIRILYVALTRARQKNIIVMSTKNFEKNLQELSLDTSQKLHISAIRSAKSFSSLILAAIIRHPSADALRQKLGFLNFSKEASKLNIKILKLNKNNSSSEVKSKSKEKFSYNFAYDLEQAQEDQENIDEEILKPKFLEEDDLLGLDTGNIYHKFMEFSDFKEAKMDPENYILKLLKREVLTPFEAKFLNVNKIRSFLDSELCNRIIKSNRVLKEYEFTTKNSAGIVDLVFEESDGFVIVDYKTTILKNPNEFISKYKKQLENYKKALNECFDKKVKEILLYSFYFGKTISFQNKISLKTLNPEHIVVKEISNDTRLAISEI